jgi:hypothetical protein
MDAEGGGWKKEERVKRGGCGGERRGRGKKGGGVEAFRALFEYVTAHRIRLYAYLPRGRLNQTPG